MTRRQSYWAEIEAKYPDGGDSITCKICGRSFLFLGAHLKSHGLTEIDYKDRFGLLHKVPLCVAELQATYRENAKHQIENGVICNPDDIVKLKASKRNSGKHMPPEALRYLGERSRGKVPSDSTRRRMSAYQKNRPESHAENLGRAVSEAFRKKRIAVKCAQCGNEIRRTVTRIKKQKYHFCNNDCFAGFLTANGSAWVSHTKQPPAPAGGTGTGGE